MFSHHRLVPNKSNNVTILDDQLRTTKQNQVSHLGMRRNGLKLSYENVKCAANAKEFSLDRNGSAFSEFKAS